jgi:hypothetical protein
MSKKSKELRHPKTLHVINLGTTKEPDFMAGEWAEDILSEYETKGQLVGTYELTETRNLKLTQSVEEV